MGRSILQHNHEVCFTKRIRSHLGGLITIQLGTGQARLADICEHSRDPAYINIFICIKTSVAFSITRIAKLA